MRRRRKVLAAILLGVALLIRAVGPTAAQQTPTPAPHGYRGAAQPVPYQGAFSDLAIEIDGFWAATFVAEGASYVSPNIVVVEEPTPGACGLVYPEPNAFYCPFDYTIYLIPQFLTDLQAEFGDYAPITVLSHEWGHHIQALLGIEGPTSRIFELQADCLMGVFTRYADDQGLLDYGDFMEAIRTSEEGGDKVYLPEDAPGSHGQSEDRVKALTRGYGGGPVVGCELSFDRVLDILEYLPSVPPVAHAACFRTEDDGILNFEQLVGRFSGIPDAETRLHDWGWRTSGYRTFACDGPPPGEAGWIDISVHLFSDGASAQEAVDYFAETRAQGTTLIPGGTAGVGDYSTTLSGPASNGAEFTVYASQGPLLVRVTGVSPSGIPFGNVLAVARNVLAARVQSSPPTAPQPSAGLPSSSLLPSSPAVNHGDCFRVLTEGAYSYSAVATALQEVGLGNSEIDALGWQDGAYRVFTCADPPFGRASQIDVVIHRFHDASSARQALPHVDNTYTPGDNESRSCDTTDALVICVTGRSLTGSPLSDVAFVLQDVVAAAE